MPETKTVSVHPLVLLSVVDHYNRVAKETKKRVVGVLLGSVAKDEVDVTNSFAGALTHRAASGLTQSQAVRFTSVPIPRSNRYARCAVPFEEDAKDPTIWFMDHSYMENMSNMFRKVNGAARLSVFRRLSALD